MVTCGGLDCSTCDFLATVNNISGWFFGAAFAVAVLFLVLGGFFRVMTGGEEDGTKKAKRWISSSVWGFGFSLLAFMMAVTTFSVAGSKRGDSWFQIKCEGDSISTVEPSEEYSAGDSAYLDENRSGQIVYANNINALTSGDNRIIKLNTDNLSTENFLADLKNLPTERKIKFVLGDESLSEQEIIRYKNLDLGFDAEKLSEYTVAKNADPLLGDSLKDSAAKIQEIASLNSTDVEDYYLVKNGAALKKVTGEALTEADQAAIGGTAAAIKTMGTVAGLEGKAVYAYVSGDPIGEIDKCLSSGGELNEFRNKCLAEKETYAGRNLNCSDLYNPIYECDCPQGAYRSGEKCLTGDENIFGQTNKNDNGEVVSNKNDNNDEKIAKTYCKDVFLEEKICPASRCEGDKMMNYPNSVKNTCTDTPSGPLVKKALCTGEISADSGQNQKCKETLDAKSDEEKRKEAEDAYNKNKQSPNWYDNILDKEYKKGEDVGSNQNGTDNGSNSGTGADNGKTGPDNGQETGPLPPDKGAGNFNPAPSFKDLKECIGLKDDQIPYNGILVVLLNPADPLNRKHVENISRMFYLARDGKLIGKNGGSATETGGQEYGARTYDKSTTGSPNGPSMWGRGWKIFKGPTKYDKNGWTDHCSYGSHDGFKTGVSERALDEANLKGGKVTSVSRCGQHIRNKYSSAGCATMGDNTRCGFINTSKSYMTKSNGTIMQINLVGEMNQANGKFSSPDCGKIDYCSAKKAFENNSGSRRFKNDPNDGYDAGDKRRVSC